MIDIETIEGLSAEEAFKALNEVEEIAATTINESVIANTKTEMTEGNPVSGKLTPRIDSMLQDMAQMYGLFDYKDIIDFNPTADDVKALKAIYRKWVVESQYAEDETDNVLHELANKVLTIIDKDDEIVKTEDDLYEGLDIDSADIKIPAPYDKYFTVSDYDPEEYTGEYMLGDIIDHYDVQLLAYLNVKPEYAEFFDDALLVDDPEYPVVEIVGGRMYPLNVTDIFEGFSTDTKIDITEHASLHTVCPNCNHSTTIDNDGRCASCNYAIVQDYLDTIDDPSSEYKLIFNDDIVSKAISEKPRDKAPVIRVTKEFFDCLVPTIHRDTAADSDLGAFRISELEKPLLSIVNMLRDIAVSRMNTDEH